MIYGSSLSLSLTHINIFHIDSLISLISVHVSVFGFVVNVCMCKGWLSRVCVEGLALWFACLMWFGHEKADGSPTVLCQRHTHTHTSIKPRQRNFPAKSLLRTHAWHLVHLWACVCVWHRLLLFTHTHRHIHTFGRRSGCRYEDDTAETTSSQTHALLCYRVWFVSINVWHIHMLTLQNK